jgi:hypothetical protein
MRCRFLLSGVNGVYYGLKSSILDKDNDLFLSGSKVQSKNQMESSDQLD